MARARTKRKARPRTIMSGIMRESILNFVRMGHTMSQISRLEGMPCINTLADWVANPSKARPGFVEDYNAARELGYDMLEDHARSVAEDSSRDWLKKTVMGKTILIPNLEHIQRDKLRIDTAFRVLKARRKAVYGETVDVKHSVTINIEARLTAARDRAAKLELERSQGVIEGQAVEITGDVGVEQSGTQGTDIVNGGRSASPSHDSLSNVSDEARPRRKKEDA